MDEGENGVDEGVAESFEEGLEAGDEVSVEAPMASVNEGGATVSRRRLLFSILSPPCRSCAMSNHGRARSRLSISTTSKLSFVQT